MSLRVLAYALALLAIVATVASAQNDTVPYDNLNDCVNWYYNYLQQLLCQYYKECNADLCSGSNQYYYDELVTACQYFTGQTGDLTQKIKDKCDASHSSSKKTGAIVGGVVGGLAGIAGVGAIGALGYHFFVSAIPLLSHMGLAGADAAAGGAATSGANGASHTATASGHAATSSAGAHSGAQAAGHSTGATAAGHGAPSTGPGPVMGDGGAGHAVGQGAAQAPMATDGGSAAHSAMSGGQSMGPSSGQGMGPYNGQAYGPSAGQGFAPSGQGYGPYPGQSAFPDPSSASSPMSGGSAPFASDGGTAGQAGGYSPTISTSPTTPSTSTGPIGQPPLQFERTRWSLFGRSRSQYSEEERQRLAAQPQMVQVPSSASFPSSYNAPSTPSVAQPPSWPQQPLLSVDSPPVHPSSAQVGVQLNSSIEYTAPPRAPYARLGSNDARTE